MSYLPARSTRWILLTISCGRSSSNLACKLETNTYYTSISNTKMWTNTINKPFDSITANITIKSHDCMICLSDEHENRKNNPQTKGSIRQRIQWISQSFVAFVESIFHLKHENEKLPWIFFFYIKNVQKIKNVKLKFYRK